MPGVWTWGFGERGDCTTSTRSPRTTTRSAAATRRSATRTAETVERTLRPSAQRYVDKPVTEREWYRAWPPDKKFLWSLRNNTNYMETGCLSILDWTAKNAKDMLRNFYRKGYNSWQKGVKGNPYAFVIPEDQGDPRRVAQMIELLRDQRHRGVAAVGEPVTVKEGTFAKGDFVVRLDQPYRNYAVDLLEPQKFPTRRPTSPTTTCRGRSPCTTAWTAKRIDDEKIARRRARRR